MGEIAEMMLEGAMCPQCGEFIDDGEDCGYPRLCAGCAMQEGAGRSLGAPKPHKAKQHACSCGKRFAAPEHRDQHMRDTGHGSVAP